MEQGILLVGVVVARRTSPQMNNQGLPLERNRYPEEQRVNSQPMRCSLHRLRVQILVARGLVEPFCWKKNGKLWYDSRQYRGG